MGYILFVQVCEADLLYSPFNSHVDITRSESTFTKVRSKWSSTNPEQDLSKEEKRKLLSMVAKIATHTIFRHHCYQFDGVVYRQATGGPIGLRFISIVARIVMDHWIRGFIHVIISAGVELHGIMKYVDDVNLVMAMLRIGTRWVDNTLEHRLGWEEEDMLANRTQEDVTMTAMRTAVDSIIPWLQFTSDEPGQHESATVPMLDLQVWVRHPRVEDELGFDTLGWSFYEKATSSDRVLRASSAYGWRSKIVTLTMEVFRRMRNTTRQATQRHRCQILEVFIRKLRMSGYVEKTVTGILRSGLQFYSRKLRIELQGGPQSTRERWMMWWQGGGQSWEGQRTGL